ncbi:MAG: rod shape-determining protein RodA [bacterium]|nr:rod shape-determining protein RodA [bacterium]
MIYIRWDRILIGLTIIMGLIGVGLVALASADAPWTFSNLALKQSIFFLVGIIIIWIVSRIDYRFLCRYSWWLYGGVLLLLIVTLVLGKVAGGSQRWIEFWGIRIQPSEFAKLILVFSLADAIARIRHGIGWLWASIVGLIIILPPMGLILLQPDLGTALVFLAIWFVMLFIGGMNLKILFMYFAIGAASIPIALPFLKDYQRARLTAFMHPEDDPLAAGYQIIQSKIAIGHGGLFGQGLFNGSQNALDFIPGEHTDFIFAIAAEETGMVGAGLVLLGLFLLIMTGLAISEVTDDLLGKLVAGGLIGMITFQVVVNVGITLGLLPVTGIPLPFISYGGSALLTNCIAIGVLANIYRHAIKKGQIMSGRRV